MANIVDLVEYRRKHRGIRAVWRKWGYCWHCKGKGADYRQDERCVVCGAIPHSPPLEVILIYLNGRVESRSFDTNDVYGNKLQAKLFARSVGAEIIQRCVIKYISSMREDPSQLMPVDEDAHNNK